MLPQDELLDIVVADLRYLTSEWGDSITDDALRRGSTVLRRLLAGGELQRAWKASGRDGEPTIECSTLAPLLIATPLERIAFASAGGADFDGAELRGTLVVNYAMTPEQMQANFAQGVPFASMGLRAFAEATCIIVRGEQVNRRRLIKYVANKLGGAHHDTKRGTDHEEHLYSLLDESRQTMQLMGKPTVYFELLSIGQALARSPDIRLLIGDPAT